MIGTFIPLDDLKLGFSTKDALTSCEFRSGIQRYVFLPLTMIFQIEIFDEVIINDNR